MNNRLIIFLFSVVLFFSACKKDDLENQAGIKLYDGVDFVISSIQYGSENQIHCVGTFKNTNATLLLSFNRSLELIKTTRISEITGLKGELELTYLPSKDWLITSKEINYDFSTLTAFITDEKFNILNSKELVKMPNSMNASPNSGRSTIEVFDQKVLADGDLAITCDTVYWDEISQGFRLLPGIKIMRLSPNLDFRYSPFIGERDYQRDYNEPRVSELEDGSLFYMFLAKNDNPFLDDHLKKYGIIEKTGIVRYTSEKKLEFINSIPISLSKADENVVITTILNKDEQQEYTLINPATGDLLNKTALEKNIVNNGFNGPNRLPSKLQHGYGHFLYSKDIQRLFFLEVDALANVTQKFEVVMPEFDEMLSYRQLFTPEDNVILGASFENEGILYFLLHEYTPDGEQLDWNIKK